MTINVKMKYIPAIRFSNGKITKHVKDKTYTCIRRQQESNDGLMTVTTYDLIDVDLPHPELKNKTFRQLLMEFRTKDDQPLFFGVDPHWSGPGYIITFPEVFEHEARAKAAAIFKYLERTYGDKVFRWATPEARANTHAMDWDEKNGCPITVEEKELDAIIAETEGAFWLTKKKKPPPDATDTDLQRPPKTPVPPVIVPRRGGADSRELRHGGREERH